MNPGALDETSQGYTAGLMAALKGLPGTARPESVGGGVVAAPEGLLHVGDLIHHGDKAGADFAAMQQTEWAAYTKAFDALPFSTRDILGNHDAPHGTGLVAEQMAARHRARRDLQAISDNGLHYSWTWGGVHFVALGLVVGTDRTVDRPRRYAAMDSLDFLRADLDAHCARDQPLILMHHVDLLRYSETRPGVDVTKWEWDPADVQAFHAAIAGRRTAIFYGHTHRRQFFRWDGTDTPGASGIAVFNVTQASHFLIPHHGLYQAEVEPGRIIVREYLSTDAWQSAAWTPQTWTVEL